MKGMRRSVWSLPLAKQFSVYLGEIAHFLGLRHANAHPVRQWWEGSPDHAVFRAKHLVYLADIATGVDEREVGMRLDVTVT